MYGHRIVNLNVSYDRHLIDKVVVQLELNGEATFECVLYSEGEGDFRSMSLEEIERRAILYAVDSIKSFNINEI